jgi:NitT/TauT family transport system ATP-binding protein
MLEVQVPAVVGATGSLAVKIRLKDVEKTFVARAAAVHAVLKTNLDIPDGQFACLVGPSGCGKTTLLRIVAGLERQSSGEVQIQQADPSRPTNNMIFQQESIFPWMSVWNNVEFAMRIRGVPKEERHMKTDRWIRKVGLARFKNAFPYQLSGGMKQRVSIARAFANDPEILLMDEPFAALDQQTKLLLQAELIHIWEDTHKTVLFVTHSIDEAVALGDRVIVMTAHPGRIKAELPINIPRPRDPMEIRTMPEYLDLTQRIWHLLRDEVLKAKEQEGVE